MFFSVSPPGRPPIPDVAFAWGSRSTRRVRFSLTARGAARLPAVVVFPTPPFWLATAMTWTKRFLLQRSANPENGKKTYRFLLPRRGLAEERKSSGRPRSALHAASAETGIPRLLSSSFRKYGSLSVRASRCQWAQRGVPMSGGGTPDFSPGGGGGGGPRE